MHKLLLPTLCLLALDLGATALSPATGLSLTADAAAADFTGKIKRIRIKKTRAGSSFKVQVKTTDGGDGTAADAASLELRVCDPAGCTDADTALVLDQDEYVATFESGLFTFDGALVPEGEYALATELVAADGGVTGELQGWTMTAKGGEVTVTADAEVETTPYVLDLGVVADECGNGRIESRVGGSGADDVRGVRWISLDGVSYLYGDDAEDCDGLPCQTGLLSGGAATYNQSKAALGDFAAGLGEDPEAAVLLSVTAKDASGGVLGTVETAAVAKYGDILIDGVPLEFDRPAGDDGGSGITGVTVTTAVDGAAVLSTWTDGDAGVSTLTGTLTDIATGEVQECKATESGAVQQSFASPLIEFDAGEPPDKYPYRVLVDLLDSKGDPTGTQYEAELVMPGFGGETVGTDHVVFDDGLGAVGLLQGEDGIIAHVAWEGGGDVAGAIVIFEEPFEGPPPLETEVLLEQVASFDRSALTCSGKVPEAWTAEVTAFDKEGAVLGTVSGSGEGEGVVYAVSGNGKGTRKASSQAEQQHVPLL